MLYTIQNHPYIYTFVSCSVSEASATFAPFARKGEEVTVPAIWAAEYHGDGTDIFEQLAIKACRKYGTEEGRTHRAALIVRENNPASDEGCIGVGQRGELRMIAPDRAETYTVTTKSCNCKDSQFSRQICKHRIAAWMYEQRFGKKQIIPDCYQFIWCMDCMTHHWIETSNGKEICHGENYDPRTNLPYGAKVKQSNFSSARNPATIEIIYQ